MVRWKTIPGYEGIYEVSDTGLVRSVDRTINRAGIIQPLRGKILRSGRNKKTGYHQVGLSKKGVPSYVYVHRLVALAFIPNPNNLPEVNHKDLNKSNNNSGNLEWSTHSGNKLHAVTNGVKFNPNPKRGEDAGPAVLTWEKVRKIRHLRQKNPNVWTQNKLAKRFNVTQANVWNILHNKTWKEDQAGLTHPVVEKGEKS